VEKTGKAIITWAVKILVFVGAWAYVVYKFLHTEQDISTIFSSVYFSIPLFVVVCLGMFFNWAFEALKWQQLVNCSQNITFRKAISGVLVGLPLALITPNRIGEIGGRSIVLEKGHKDAICATFLGSLTQLFATLFFGCFGLLIYCIAFPIDERIQKIAILSTSLFCIILAIVVYCKNKRWIKNLFLTCFGKKFYKQILHLLQIYKKKDVAIATCISCLRYAIFSSQFGILINMLIPELSFIEIFIGITLTYFITTIIPTSVLGEIGIRGSVAMAVFEIFTNQITIVFQISILVWLINIVIPTLVGSFILLNLKRKKK